MDRKIRRLILEKAAKTLVKTGGDRLTVRQLAADAKTSTQSIYTLFGGKEGIVVALFEEGWKRLIDELEQIPVTTEPLEDLLHIGYCYVRFARKNQHFYELMLGKGVAGVSVPDREVSHAEPWLKITRDAVQRAIDAKLLSGSPELIGRQLWIAAHGHVDLSNHGFLSPKEDESVVRQIAAGVFAAFAGPKHVYRLNQNNVKDLVR
ncbi:MAG: TetR/AcrR family transcriptional regulator [Pseudomonadota bacterium]